MIIKQPEKAFGLTELDDWESRILWDTQDAAEAKSSDKDHLAPRNHQFEQGDWLKGIIWDSTTPYQEYSRLNLNMNDTKMVLEVQSSTDRSSLRLLSCVRHFG
jgi:hypothetical protein